MYKKHARLRRANRSRQRLKKLVATRLVIHRSLRHIYAQVISPNCSEVLVSASTLEKELSSQLKYTGNKIAASIVGQKIAERAIAKGIKNISLDRSGFKYHGCVQELADSARKAGLQF